MVKLISNIGPITHAQEISSLCEKADHIILVSPFLFDDFSQWLSLQPLAKTKRIELITSLKPQGDNQIRKPGALHSFLKCLNQTFPHIEPFIHINNTLHGKVYLFKCQGQFIGGIITSANLTTSGLSLNDEWGVLVKDEALLAQVEQEIFDSLDYPNLSKEIITNKMLPLAAREAEKRQIENKDIDVGLLSILKHQAVSADEIKTLSLERAHSVFLKPHGHAQAPVLLYEQKRFGDITKLHFPNPRPKDVRPGDIIVSFGTGSRAVLCIHTAMTGVEGESIKLQEISPDAKRWPWFVIGHNHTPHFGNKWWEYNLTIDALGEEYCAKNPNNPLTRSGGQSFGSLQYGSGRLAIDKKFAAYIIEKVMHLENLIV